MRNIILAAAVAGLTISSCVNHSSDRFFSDHRKSTTISIDNGFNALKIQYSGEVIFNDDETAIESISDDGYVKFKYNRKKLFAESDGHGGVKYELYNGSSRVDINGNGKEFIADAVKTMVNHGVDAKGRVARLYKNGGTTAVLNKISDIESAHVKQIYIGYLLENSSLSVNEKVLVLQNIASVDGADYEKSQILGKYADQFSSPDLNQAFFIAVKSINGNYEKSQVLKSAIRTMHEKESVKGILIASKSINANYEKSEILKELLQSSVTIDDEYMSVLIDVVSDIDASYEKAEVLKSLLNRNDLTPSAFDACIKVISTIDGNYEKTELLKLAAQKNIPDDNTWIKLIEAAAKIDANHEKSNVLIKVAEKMPATTPVRDAYTAAAKTIEAEYEYEQTMKAIR